MPKSTLRTDPVSPSSLYSGSRDELHARIAAQAYAVWEQNGRVDGHALEHWLRAEREIVDETKHLRVLQPALPPPQGR